MNILNTPNAPAAVGPYVQGIVPTAPGVPVFLSGQIGLIPSSGVLAESGLTLNDVLYANVLLEDMGDFKEMNGYYAEIFGDHRPTRAAYAAKALPLGALVEIVVVAWKKL